MIHTQTATCLREQAALYALGALPADERATFARHLDAGCAVCRAEVERLGDVTGALAGSAPAVPPPPALRERLLAEARASAPARFRFLLEGEGEWRAIQPGVFRKDLSADATGGAASYLIRMDPGAGAPTHRHGAAEHCYVVEGDLRVAGRHIRAGDFHLAEAGSTHEGLRTEGGCLLLIVESRT